MRHHFSIFLLLLFATQSCFAQSLDLRLYDDCYGHRNTSLDGTAKIITQSTYPISLAVPIVQALSGLALKDPKQMQNALQTVGGLTVATIITYGLKYSIRRERPYIAHPQYNPDDNETSPSFPSGHASIAFTTATNLSLQYRRWYVIVPAYAWAAAVGYSRIHLGAHYPSDVLCGALVGAGSAWVSFQVNKWLQHKWLKKELKKGNVGL
ncbi:MAG: phosphatase PAP2 family protein [Bacteroidetes bacterium]|nr:phosphatase PAP2 family protein [Bacteroidota bacterium]